MILGIQGKEYEDKFKELNLQSLEERRIKRIWHNSSDQAHKQL